MSLANELSTFFGKMQGELFPYLEEAVGPLSPQLLELVRVIETSGIDGFIPRWRDMPGRPLHERSCLARAFLAKTVLQIPTNVLLVERLRSDKSLRQLCGFLRSGEVPSEATFSRAFAEFADSQLPSRVHAALIKATLGDHLVGHISRDSTAIEAREKPVVTAKPPPKEKKKKGRPRKGEEKTAKEPGRIELQLKATTLAEMLTILPIYCGVGTKRNANGHQTTWIGYKLHIDTADGGVPVSCLLTSASLHDSQAAIPLAMMTASRVTNLYDLMDSAYDAPGIYDHSRSLGHVPIIDKNPRANVALQEKIKGEAKAQRAAGYRPAESIRYNERSTAERCNSSLKDNYGARTIYVRGAAKVMCHLMFGILAITVNQLFRLVT